MCIVCNIYCSIFLVISTIKFVPECSKREACLTKSLSNLVMSCKLTYMPLWRERAKGFPFLLHRQDGQCRAPLLRPRETAALPHWHCGILQVI